EHGRHGEASGIGSGPRGRRAGGAAGASLSGPGARPPLDPRLLRVAGLRDTVSGFLALRLIVLRQALRRDTTQFLQTEGWCASAELVARLAPHARRLDAVPAAARYDLVQRPSRVRPWRQLLEAWRARSVIRAARTVV